MRPNNALPKEPEQNGSHENVVYRKCAGLILLIKKTYFQGLGVSTALLFLSDSAPALVSLQRKLFLSNPDYLFIHKRITYSATRGQI